MGSGQEAPVCLSEIPAERSVRVAAPRPTLGWQTRELREVRGCRGGGGPGPPRLRDLGAGPPQFGGCSQQRGGASARPQRRGPCSFPQLPPLFLFPSLNPRFIQAFPSPAARHKEERRGIGGWGVWWLLNLRTCFPLSRPRARVCAFGWGCRGRSWRI